MWTFTPHNSKINTTKWNETEKKMKKENASPKQSRGKHPDSIPDIDIIDLDADDIPEDENPYTFSKPGSRKENPDEKDSAFDRADGTDIDFEDMEESSDTDYEEDSNMDSNEPPRKKGFRINTHMILLAMVVVVFAVIFFRFKNWGQFISQDEIKENIEGTYDDTLDLIVSLTDEDGKVIPLDTSDGLSIVAFGNSPFADDRDSEDNLANIIAEMTGATVYNCSIGDSYLAAEWPIFSAADRPRDAYTFYWLALLAGQAGNDQMFIEAEQALGDAFPEDAQAALDTLRSIDFSTVDVIAIMYDAYDYLIGHAMYNDENPTDIMQFTGNLEAGIEYLQSVYPHIRIIVMSPTYAFSNEVDENGEYISSDIVRYGRDVLSTYVIKEYSSCASRQVTFIDNLYGTVTEDNAKEYLIDNIHLNVEGRKKVAERFVYALNYFNKD